jgi:hypothetical protein
LTELGEFGSESIDDNAALSTYIFQSVRLSTDSRFILPIRWFKFDGTLGEQKHEYTVVMGNRVGVRYFD